MPLIPLVVALAVLLALGWLERRARDRAWRSIPIRVHVNGTRGKSTVTRLIWSALREAGIATVAKTTGTEPRLLLPDGSERPVRRLAPASIREQLQLLRAARRHRARAVVAECMAIDPELQWVSERRMLHASIAVVTNVRPDHVEVMGESEASIAGCLANMIPPGGLVVAGGPETARLLEHWRHHPFAGIRPFFCQVEAAETAIWLTEVAPQTKAGKRLLDHLVSANRDANPQLMRLALKLATGAGKTTVMAMLIAWQTINAVRRPNSHRFTRGFLVVTPGLTIRDRLRVLQPNDPDSYYQSRELVPSS